MSKQRDREEFVSIMAKEGVNLTVARLLMRQATTLQRLAELECSSEAADRDRVPCPETGKGRPREGKTGRAEMCLCEHWRSQDGMRGCGCADPMNPDQHHKVPRIAVKEAQTRRRVERLCSQHTPRLEPVFGGDPRGAVLKIKVPSGRTNDGGQEGVCVP